ncbi:uncharacterized protein VP01_2655g4 [Puccinia sorghi]|uniref:Uncharacterized protein n=1 Tax=Puccinia sorghi TaxID=27349 RepID=A0A0L6V4T3_9BASI|nr:uncharacterized protein VP01_2655g4 [Puccinia sorghi]
MPPCHALHSQLSLTPQDPPRSPRIPQDPPRSRKLRVFKNSWTTSIALRALCQTGTVSGCTQELNSHARTVGLAETPLMSLYQHGLKENIQFVVLMRNIKFTSLRTMQAMALKAGQKNPV